MGKLYIVGTPIGNLGDITYRAVDTLKKVDVIACEDTRHSSILLQHYDIHKPTISYHKFNEKQMTPKLIDMLNDGKNIALITDAGMPGVSDPGAILLREIVEQGLDFELVPGATAVATAVVGGCLGDGKFCFIGFLPEKKSERDKLLEQYKCANVTLVFYSATHDINKDLDYLFLSLGNCEVVIANELTKKFEKFLRGNLETLRLTEPKGEYVILVQHIAQENELNQLNIEEHFKYYSNKGETKMNAIKLVAKDRGVKKNDIYNYLNNK